MLFNVDAWICKAIYPGVIVLDRDPRLRAGGRAARFRGGRGLHLRPAGEAVHSGLRSHPSEPSPLLRIAEAVFKPRV